MGKKEYCYACGNIHKMMTTPGIENYVNCPYDVDGKAIRKGMEGAIPRMEENRYGVWAYVPPKRCKCGEWIEVNNA